MRSLLKQLALPAFVAALAAASVAVVVSSAAGRSAAVANGSMIEHDSLVAKTEPGTHKGGGLTIGYSFFTKAKDLPLVFRKRALHPGSSIGLHTQKEDEIYYVLSGAGDLTLDGVRSTVGPGTAILTRTGSSHTIRPVGDKDLVLIITYPSGKPAAKP
jgi:quercetin dioxygenase-like cupin family protein